MKFHFRPTIPKFLSNLPIHSRTMHKTEHDTKLASCVFPPTLYCTADLLSAAQIGKHPKNWAQKLLSDYKNGKGTKIMTQNKIMLLIS